MKIYEVREHNDLIRVLGRRAKDCKDGVLFWTGSGVELAAKCSELWIEVEADFDSYEPWISWSVNGAAMGRMPLSKGRTKICLFRGMNPDKVKEVRILKDVQAMSGDGKHWLMIHSVTVEGELVPVREHALKMEFIGDSITSGEGTIGATCEEDWISMFFSTKNNYSVLTADQLDAEFRIISQSGWGLYVSWDNHHEATIPPIYEQVCGLCWGEQQVAYGCKEPYDFTEWQPDVVVINLGTNDNGAFDQPAYTDPSTGITYKMLRNEDGSLAEESTALIKQTIREFLATLRKNNPKAELVWVLGMLGIELEPHVIEAIRCYQAETDDKKVHYLQLEPTNDDTVGARFHPGVRCHEQAADRIATYVKTLVP